MAPFACTLSGRVSLSANQAVQTGHQRALNAEATPGSHTYDISMKIFTDSTFQTIASNNHPVPVPKHVFIGLELQNGFSQALQFEKCWITPDANPDNPISYQFLTNGCPPPQVKFTIQICNILLYYYVFYRYF